MLPRDDWRDSKAKRVCPKIKKPIANHILSHNFTCGGTIKIKLMKYTYLIVLIFAGVLLNEISQMAPPDKKFISGIFEIILIYASCLIVILFALQGEGFQNIPKSSKNLFITYWFYTLFITIYGIAD